MHARPRPETGAITLVARSELRERGWGLLVLALVLGVGGGVVLGAVALGERTGTAYSRLVDAVHLDDARILVPADQPRLAAAVPTLPGVDHAWTAQAYIAQPDAGSIRFLSIAASTRPHPDLVTPVLVAGRSPDPASPDEVVVSEQIAEEGTLALGSVHTMRLLTLRNVADFAVGFTPAGPASRLTVVGVARMPKWGGTLPDVLGGPGFAAANEGGAIGTVAYVRLQPRPGALADFTGAFTAASAAEPSAVADYLAGPPETPRLSVDEAVVAAERALLVGVGVFALVVGLGVLQVVGLGLLRSAAAAREARVVERALGMTARQSAGARVLAAVPGAVVAAVLGAAVTLLAGTLEPLGSQARFEPTVGFRPQWALALVGGLVLALVFLALTAGAVLVAWRRGRETAPEPARDPTPLVAAGEALRRWPSLLLGARLARGAGVRRGLPPVVTTVAAVAAVAGIVATVVVGASLTRLVDEPARWANGADIALPDSRPDDVAALVADPRTVSVAVADTVRVRTAAEEVLGMSGLRAVKGIPPVDLVSGRLPAAPDEVAVNPRVAQRYGLADGTLLPLRAADGSPRPLRTVGIVVAPRDDRRAPGQDLLVAEPTLAGYSTYRTPQLTAYVTARPGEAAALRAELATRLEVAPDLPPDAIRNLADLVRLPGLLAVLLAVVAGTGLAHSLLVTARRLAREMAVFSVLGATPGQVRTTLTILAATTAVPAVVLGVPLGLGVARLFWWQVATTIGVGGDIAVPGWPIVVLVAAVPVGAALVTLVPALRFARMPASTSLATL